MLRPTLYYSGGGDPKVRRFDAAWQVTDVRFGHVLVASPVLPGALTIGSIVWTGGYVRGTRKRTAARLDEIYSR